MCTASTAQWLLHRRHTGVTAWTLNAMESRDQHALQKQIKYLKRSVQKMTSPDWLDSTTIQIKVMTKR